MDRGGLVVSTSVGVCRCRVCSLLLGDLRCRARVALFDASSVPFLCSGAKRASLPFRTRKMHELALSDSKNVRSVSMCFVRLGI